MFFKLSSLQEKNKSLRIYLCSQRNNGDEDQVLLFCFRATKTAMASGASKSAAFLLSILNIGLYFIITVIASWAVNHGIERSRETASVLSIPARIFPIYLPMGNVTTGFFIIFCLLAGVVGITTSLTGLQNVLQWDSPNMHAAATSSLTSLSLTLLAMGLACKEINVGWTDSNLRTLEIVMIIVSSTQLVCTGAIQAGVEDIDAQLRRPGAIF